MASLRSTGIELHIHTIPLPPGWDVDEVWDWLAQGLLLPTDQEPVATVTVWLDCFPADCEVCVARQDDLP